MYTVNDANFPWLNNVHKNIINECGVAYIWTTQTFINSDWFISSVAKYRNNKKCLLCDTNDIEDEIYYILQC